MAVIEGNFVFIPLKTVWVLVDPCLYRELFLSNFGEVLKILLQPATMADSGAYASITAEFDKHGLTPPRGLIHILFHSGNTRREVYRSLWSSLMFVGKLSTGGRRTLVYPKVLRDTVRERFGGDPEAGAYDTQYEGEETAYHVTMEDILSVKWRDPPKSCTKCH